MQADILEEAMSGVVDLQKARLEIKARKAFRNWTSRFEKEFELTSRVRDIPDNMLSLMVTGREDSTFYYYDFIMNIEGLGSGFDFDGLAPDKKIHVIDRHFFLLDRFRYEFMKRLGWVDSYPGDEYTIAELVTGFNILAPDLQAKPVELNSSHPAYEKYRNINLFEKEQVIRKLIPEALELIEI